MWRIPHYGQPLPPPRRTARSMRCTIRICRLAELIPLWLLHLGEIIYGGVGSGLYGMLAFVIVAVFVAGLMVGRTPEYLGKKIESYEMKMASLILLIPIFTALGGTAIGVLTPAGQAGVLIPARTATLKFFMRSHPLLPIMAVPLPG